MISLPGPGATSVSTPTVVDAPGKQLGVLVETKAVLDVTPKLLASDDFTSLNNFVTVYGEPTITTGMLAGEGVVRYKNQCLTDSHKVTAVVGDVNTGTTRLVLCGDETFVRYYALELSAGTFAIIRGNGASSVETGNGLLALLFNLLVGLFSLFNLGTEKTAETAVDVEDGDEIAVSYTESDSTIRTYVNDVETACTMQVPRGDIPHGVGNRWCGAAVGLDLFLGVLLKGPLLTSITIEDL